MQKLWIVLGVIGILLGSAVTGLAAPQVITATGTYVMGENDSPKIAKEAARQEALRSATEQAGVYVESYSKTQNMVLSEDDVRVLSGAIMKVTDEKATPTLTGNVWKYTVTLTATVDADNVDLKALMAKRKELEHLQQERDELKKQNQELLEKYQQSSGSEKDALGTQLENQYSLNEQFDSIASAIQQGKNHKAVRQASRIIDDQSVTDSPLSYAYFLRGRAYYGLKSQAMALDDFNSAQNTPHNNTIYPIWRVHYYRGLIYYDQRRYQEAYDELKLAWDASDKTDEDMWNALARAEEKVGEENGTRKKRHKTNWGAVAIGAAVIGGIIAAHNHHKHEKERREHAAPPPPRGHFAHGWGW